MRTRLIVIASAGGHMYEALQSISRLRDDPLFVTYKSSHIPGLLKGRRVLYVTHPRRSPLRLVINCFQSLIILIRTCPRFVLTTGADVAVPMCVLCKFTGAKLIYIETGASVLTPSITGRILYKLADLFIVQWPPLLKHFPRAILGGPLL